MLNSYTIDNVSFMVDTVFVSALSKLNCKHHFQRAKGVGEHKVVVTQFNVDQVGSGLCYPFLPGIIKGICGLASNKSYSSPNNY